MKRKELIKTFMMISKWKDPLVSMVRTKTFKRCKGSMLAHLLRRWDIIKTRSVGKRILILNEAFNKCWMDSGCASIYPALDERLVFAGLPAPYCNGDSTISSLHGIADIYVNVHQVSWTRLPPPPPVGLMKVPCYLTLSSLITTIVMFICLISSNHFFG